MQKVRRACGMLVLGSPAPGAAAGLGSQSGQAWQGSTHHCRRRGRRRRGESTLVLSIGVSPSENLGSLAALHNSLS